MLQTIWGVVAAIFLIDLLLPSFREATAQNLESIPVRGTLGSTPVQSRLVDENNLPITSLSPTVNQGSPIGPTAPLYPGGYRYCGTSPNAGTPDSADEAGAACMDNLGRVYGRVLNVNSSNQEIVPVNNPCANHDLMNSVPINSAASGNVQLVALVGGQRILVCGYDVVALTAQTFTFIYGTGTACATGETALTGPMPFGATGGSVTANAGATQFKPIPSGNAACMKLGAAIQTSGVFRFVQTT
jgi:hypothetical protein